MALHKNVRPKHHPASAAPSGVGAGPEVTQPHGNAAAAQDFGVGNRVVDHGLASPEVHRAFPGGPYVYGGGTTTEEGGRVGGVAVGGGLGGAHWDRGGFELVNGHAGMGTFVDVPSGDATLGVRAHGSVAEIDPHTVGDGANGGYDGQFISGDIGLYATDETFTAGGTAAIAQGALHGGWEDHDGDTDTEVRAGLGASVGAAGRVHYGDRDGDGRNEYGFGADIGPVTFDLTTEWDLPAALEGLFDDEEEELPRLPDRVTEPEPTMCGPERPE